MLGNGRCQQASRHRDCFQQAASMFDVAANCIMNRRFFVDNRIDMAKAHAFGARGVVKTTASRRGEHLDATLLKRSGAFLDGAEPNTVIAEVKKTGSLLRFVGGDCAVLSYLLNRLMTYSTPAQQCQTYLTGCNFG